MEEANMKYIEEYHDYYQSCDIDDFEELDFDEQILWDNLWRYIELKTQPKSITETINMG